MTMQILMMHLHKIQKIKYNYMYDQTHIVLLEQDGKRDKRNRMQIWYDVLYAIKQESMNGVVKPTRVQFMSNLSYDKLIVYLNDLKSKKLIIESPLALTDRGNQFLHDYGIINEQVMKLGLEYL